VPLARTHSVALVGVAGHAIEVEVDIANGLVGMILVGLPDTALREARDRIRAAIVNSGEVWPYRRDCKTSGHVPPESSPQEYVLPSRRSLKRPGGPGYGCPGRGGTTELRTAALRRPGL
jgi:Subunit ChlI of Mg-chelatase